MAKKQKQQQRKQVQHKINEQIRSNEVRITGEVKSNIIKSGDVVTLKEALDIGRNMGVDLVEVCGTANPPVCKLIDYSKFLYEMKKKKKDAEKKQKESVQEIKEIRFGPNTDDHDYNFKLKHAQNFLEKGNIVKAYVFFKGREIHYKDKGEILLLKLATDLEELGTPDTAKPKLEGKRMTMFIRPKKNK